MKWHPIHWFTSKWNSETAEIVDSAKDSAKEEQKINSSLREVKDSLFAKLKELAGRFSWTQDLAALYRYFLDGKASLVEKIGILLAIIYLLNPMDLIPDFIPVMGFVDDGMIISFLVGKLKEKISVYKNEDKLEFQG